MDMDSTLITIECIDEIADLQGIKPQVAAITARAMRGEIDFRASLTERVALLAGCRSARWNASTTSVCAVAGRERMIARRQGDRAPGCCSSPADSRSSPIG
jgi:phosphoserine phosphatase